VGTAAADFSGKIIYVNPAFCKMVGWTENELNDVMPPHPFWPPEEIKYIMEDFQTITETEYRFQRRIGERFPILVKSAILTDGNGNKIGFVSTFTDITNQKLFESKLQASHDLLRSIMEGTTDSVYVRDLDGRYLRINSVAARRLGKAVEELIGERTTGLVSPQTIQKFRDDDKKVLGSGKEATLEVKVTANGIAQTFLTTKGSVLDPKGNVFGIFGISRDITEKKRAEEILRKSEERLSAVIDNSTAEIYMKDLEGKFLLINRKYEDLFHIPTKDLFGKTPYDLFPVGIAAKFRGNDQQVIKKKGPIEFDETVPHDDGPHDYLTVRFPPLDNKGEIYALCGISTDITDRKSREEDHMKLEKLESLGLLVGGIPHNFKNILTAILDNISLAKSFVESKDQLLSRLNEAE
jgi:PAS domain S-box-containing protein